MRNAMNRKRHWLLLLFLSFFFLSCEDKMDEHYEKPGWLKGTAWEVISSDEYGGKYSMFMEAAELSGFRPILDGKSVVTAMVPDNDAFTAYLQEQGYASVKDVPTDDLKKLIGFHLVYYSYNKRELENFRPEESGMGNDDEAVGVLQPGLYYKFRTHSTSPATQVVDPQTGNTLTTYHLERFLPVFSHYMFSSKGIDPQKNYTYFYPNSTWTGGDGFNVSSASVKDYGIVANNGYVYTIDRVLEPLETIFDVMKKKRNYSDFLDFYDQYAAYTYDVELSNNYGDALGVDSLFLHEHSQNGLPNIALEWPVSDYRFFPELASIAYSVFAPTNDAFERFFKNTWEKYGYNSLTAVDPLAMKFLLYQCVYGGSLVFPDEVHDIVNSFGTHYDFDPYSTTDVKERSICVNGSFYGLNNLSVPSTFKTVVGPSILMKDYSYFLYVLNYSNMLTAYSSNAAKYTLLMTGAENFEISDIRLTSSDGVNYKLVTSGDDGDVAVSSSKLQLIMNSHTTVGEQDLLGITEATVCPTQQSNTYWFVKNGKVTTNYAYNTVLGLPYSQSNLDARFSNLTEVKNDGENWTNGKVYAYDESDQGVFGAESGEGMAKRLATCGESVYPYYVFSKLLRKAEMIEYNIDESKVYVKVGDLANLVSRWIVFVPTNEALAAALSAGKIPGLSNASVDLTQTSPEIEGEVTDQLALQKYLLDYIFTETYAPEVSSCPYIGSETWTSGVHLNCMNKPVTYTDTGSSMTVRWGDGKTVNVSSKYDYFPFEFGDGAFQFIEDVFN